MTTSTIELMRAAIAADAGNDGQASYLNIVTSAEVAEVARAAKGAAAIPADVVRVELTHTKWGQGIQVTEDLVIIPDGDDRVPLWMARLYGDVEQRPRLRPMHPGSIPQGLTRSWRYVSFLRHKHQDPETFHRFRAADTVVHLRELLPIAGARTLDIGGQSGFMAEALRDEGAACHVVEHRCVALEPHDGQIDRSVCSDGGALPIASGSFDLVHSADLLPHVSSPARLLDEMTRVLKPGTGIGYLAFTNGRSPLQRLEANAPSHQVSIAEVLGWFAGRDDVEILTAGPRFWPSWANKVVDLPGVREVATGSLRIAFRRVP